MHCQDQHTKAPEPIKGPWTCFVRTSTRKAPEHIKGPWKCFVRTSTKRLLNPNLSLNFKLQKRTLATLKFLKFFMCYSSCAILHCSVVVSSSSPRSSFPLLLSSILCLGPCFRLTQVLWGRRCLPCGVLSSLRRGVILAAGCHPSLYRAGGGPGLGPLLLVAAYVCWLLADGLLVACWLLAGRCW